MESLFRGHRRANDLAALDPNLLLEDRPCAIVIDAGQAKRKAGHGTVSGVAVATGRDLGCGVVEVETAEHTHTN